MALVMSLADQVEAAVGGGVSKGRTFKLVGIAGLYGKTDVMMED